MGVQDKDTVGVTEGVMEGVGVADGHGPIKFIVRGGL